MTESAAGNAALWVALLAIETAGLAVVGEMAARALARVSLWRARVPEVAFLAGYAAFAALGYAALPVVITARGVLVAVALAALTAWVHADAEREPAWVEHYRVVRRTGGFRIAAAALALFCLLAAAYRMPWLLGATHGGRPVSGTAIADDARTLGLPLAIAAHGYPARSPVADAIVSAVPLGGYLYAAAGIAWMPSAALAVLLADVAAQALFYCLTMLLLASVWMGSARARAIAIAGSVLPLHIVAWTPLLGLLWVPHQALAMCALLLAAFWLVADDNGGVGMPLLFACFAAMTSVELPLMAAVALVLLAILRVRLGRRVVLVAVAAGAVYCGVNAASLSGAVDYPSAALAWWSSEAMDNARRVGGLAWPYAALLVVGAVLARRLGFSRAWLAAMLACVVCAIAFGRNYVGSALFAVHALGAFALAWQAERLAGKSARWATALLMLAFLPGVAQLPRQWRTPPDTSASRGELLRWVYGNVPLWSRVAEYRLQDASLVTDVSFLRVGNRGGRTVYERRDAVVGYTEHAKAMMDVASAVASNDFVIVPGDLPALPELLNGCGTRRFANAYAAIYEIGEACREKLETAEMQQAFARAQRALRVKRLLTLDTDFNEVALWELAEVIVADPEKAFHMRRRADALWQKGEFHELIPALESIVVERTDLPEINYTLAYSLHSSGRDPRRAVELYTRAIAQGYNPFWSRYNRGHALLMTGRFAEARKDLEDARALDPKHPGVAKFLKELEGK